MGYPKKIWNFIWKDNSIWSWIVNVILAFIIVKFLLLPGLGFVFDTDYPVVVVMSGSMEHDVDGGYVCGNSSEISGNLNFDEFWNTCGNYYESVNITKDQFKDFKFSNGFNKGDMIFVFGKDFYEVGDVIVFKGSASSPLIHRVVEINEGLYTTRGDHNSGSRSDEIGLSGSRVYGKAVFRVPYVGWLKLGLFKLLGVQ